jgi:DNA-binding sugar fermentation-stimulating protein
MAHDILIEVERFQAVTGLSDHRVGIVLANNGRLLERLRESRRIWPETVEKIRDAIEEETSRRKCASENAWSVSIEQGAEK